jgi:hypothetical protein
MKIHVSGVGALGSFVVWELSRRGVNFTWDDIESPHAAWFATTGAIIPCEDRDTSPFAMGYKFWRDTAVHWSEFTSFLEPVRTIYCQKNPPQRVTRKWTNNGSKQNPLWFEDLPGWQFDMDGFVVDTRETFKTQRVDAPPKRGSVYLMCRGVGREQPEPPTVLWGWRSWATLAPATGCPFAWGPQDQRPVIHFNDAERSFERYYFHPVANNRDWWWCGSEAILQKEPESRSERAKRGYELFLETAAKRFGDWLKVYPVSDVVQGWRPKPNKVILDALGDESVWEVRPGVWSAIPLPKSGVQAGPYHANRIIERMLKS